jgi:hypothetical protein
MEGAGGRLRALERQWRPPFPPRAKGRHWCVYGPPRAIQKGIHAMTPQEPPPGLPGLIVAFAIVCAAIVLTLALIAITG